MPIYQFRCKNCHSILEQFMGVDDDRENLMCDVCSEPLTRIFSSKTVIPNNFHGYFDTGLGQYVKGTRHMKEICKSKGKIYGSDKEIDQETEKNARNRDKELDLNFKKKMDALEPKIYEALKKE
jgi:putative FmdB family regulatory protein